MPSFLIAVSDGFFKLLFASLPKLLYHVYLWYLAKMGRTVADAGHLPVAKVDYSGSTIDIAALSPSPYMISELPQLLINLLRNNIEKPYLQNGQFQGYDKSEFWINNTRISTFFAFTDGKRLLFHDRSASAPNIQNVLHNKFDMFGAVSFENATMQQKISGRNGFFKVCPLSISLIPGFAFEDTSETRSFNLFFPRTTVIMIGFVVVLLPEDLEKATSVNGQSVVQLLPFDALPSSNNMTSKATLAVNHLCKSIP